MIRFYNYASAKPKGILDVLRWKMEGGKSKWPKKSPSKFSDIPPRQIKGDKLRLSYVGHASWLIQTGGRNILFDPVWSDRASPFKWIGPKRVNKPGIAFENLPKIDVVLISHGHYDHLDTRTLSKLEKNFSPLVIAPLGNDIAIRRADSSIRVFTYDWNQTIILNSDVSVTLVPSLHWNARGLFDYNKALWASFVIRTPVGQLYIIGDSGYGSGSSFRRIRQLYSPIRAAILPIGGYEPRWFTSDHHMNPEEAVQALIDCDAEVAFASHHGTFQLTNEAINAPEIALDKAKEAAKLTPGRFLVMRPGEARIVR